MKLILLMAILAISTLSAQTVTTISTSASKIDDDIIFDQYGNLYGSNYEGSGVFKITPDGQESLFTDGLGSPNGLAFDAEGNLLVVDNTGNKIYKVQPDGTQSVFVPAISGPSGIIRTLASDTMLVTSYITHEIWKLAPDGSLSDYLSHPQFNGPVGLCYDDNQNLYIANFTDRKIFKVTPNGEITFFSQPPLGQFIGFIAYANNYIYATAFNGHKIYRIDLAGNYQVWLGSSAGSTDGDASVARFNRPNGIRFSSTGDTLYVSDFGTKRVRKITNLTGTSGIVNPSDNFSEAVLSPNPAISSAYLDFDLLRSETVVISLLNQQGEQVSNIKAAGEMLAGHHRMAITTEMLDAGNYFVVLQSETCTKVVSLVVLPRR